jgi:hypothetical protein
LQRAVHFILIFHTSFLLLLLLVFLLLLLLLLLLQNCPPLLSVLQLTSPIPYTVFLYLPQLTQATSTYVHLHVDCLLL